MARNRKHNSKKKQATNNKPKSTRVPSPIIEPLKTKITDKAIKKYKLFFYLLIIISGTLWFMRIETKSFSLKVFDTDKITFDISSEDSSKSPICSCPNPSLNNYGFLHFFKNISITNFRDTASFTFTAPSPDNLTFYPTHRFNADIFIFRHIEEGYNLDSLIWKERYSKKENLIEEVHLNNLSFISLINNGQLKTRFLSQNFISAFLPSMTSKIDFTKNKGKYDEKVSSITADYSSTFTTQPDQLQATYLEMLGPKVAFYSDSVFELLGEKGPLLSPNIEKQKKRFKNNAVLLILDIPYVVRVSFCPWGKELIDAWHNNLLASFDQKQFKTALFYNHVPWIFLDSSRRPTLYNFFTDTNAHYSPAMFMISPQNLRLEFENPLNETEFSFLKHAAKANDREFQNPTYKEGVTFFKISPLTLNLPPEVDSGLNRLFNRDQASFEKAREIGQRILKYQQKYKVDTLPEMKNVVLPVKYYYPDIPEHNSVYFYGELNSIDFKNANFEYSYGITGNNTFNNTDLSMQNVVINNKKPYYTPIPINYSQGENRAELNMKLTGKMWVNSKRVGSRIADNTILQSLGLILSLMGIGIIGLIAQFVKKTRLDVEAKT